VVLYESVSGQLPFRGDTVPEICAEILKSAPTPLPSIAGVAGAFGDVIGKCLRRAPSDRYANVVELARALAPFAPATSRSVLETIELLGTAATAPPAREAAARTESEDVAHATTLGFTQERASKAESPSPTLRSRPLRSWKGLLSFAALLGLALVGAAVMRSGERSASETTKAPDDVPTPAAMTPLAPPAPAEASTPRGPSEPSMKATANPAAKLPAQAPARGEAEARVPRARAARVAPQLASSSSANAAAPLPSLTPAAPPPAASSARVIREPPLYRR
jgi:serine/threonine protein kinase